MSSKSYYMRVKEVMEVYQKYYNKGYTNAWIHRNHIKDRFGISIKTMYNYMDVNYKRELLRFEDKMKEIERKKRLEEIEEEKKYKVPFSFKL